MKALKVLALGMIFSTAIVYFFTDIDLLNINIWMTGIIPGGLLGILIAHKFKLGVFGKKKK